MAEDAKNEIVEKPEVDDDSTDPKAKMPKAKKEKKPRAKKDKPAPDAEKPKRALNKYQIFMKETYGKVRADHADWDSKACFKEVARLWAEAKGKAVSA
jgi:hypothetical protein